MRNIEKELAAVVRKSRSGGDFRNYIGQELLADYKVMVDENRPRNEFIQQWTYVGARPFTAISVNSGWDIQAPELPKTDMTLEASGGNIPLRYHYVRTTINRLDLHLLGEGLLTALIRSALSALDASLIYMVDWSRVQSSDFPASPLVTGGNYWLVGKPDALLTLAKSQGMTTDTLGDIVGAERVMGCFDVNTGGGVALVDPSAIYWAGEREPAVYIDEERLASKNQVQVIVERAAATWVDPYRAARYDINV